MSDHIDNVRALPVRPIPDEVIDKAEQADERANDLSPRLAIWTQAIAIAIAKEEPSDMDSNELAGLVELAMIGRDMADDLAKELTTALEYVEQVEARKPVA